jgi:hypothetical protein
MTSSDQTNTDRYPLELSIVGLSQASCNITTNGIKSYTKSFQLGPFQLTLNASDTKSGVLTLNGSLSHYLAQA